MINPNVTELQAPFLEGAAYQTKPNDGKVVVLCSASQRLFRMRKGILTASRLIQGRMHDGRIVDEKGRLRRWVPVMVTLTYRKEVEWKPEHLSDALRSMQKWAKRRGYKLPYVWVAELHKSGKLHYHAVIWIPSSLRIPNFDKRQWWPHGMTNTVRARNAYGYLSKYASKGGNYGEPEAMQYPPGARVHGIGGLTDKEAAIVAWWKLPKALRLGDEGSHKWRRQVGGGWRCIEGDAAGNYYNCGWGISAINSDKKRVRLVEKESTANPISLDSSLLVPAYLERLGESLVDHWRAYSGRSLKNQSKINRVSWNSSGVAQVCEVLDDVPSPAIFVPTNPLGRFHAMPIPF